MAGYPQEAFPQSTYGNIPGYRTMLKASGGLTCLCRQCNCEYDPTKAAGNWKGYCSRACEIAKLKWLGWKKGDSEYKLLKDADAIGSWPVLCQKIADASAVRSRVRSSSST
jgi:hypothetical protein